MLPVNGVLAQSSNPISAGEDRRSSIVVLSHHAADDGSKNVTCPLGPLGDSPDPSTADRPAMHSGEISKTSFENRCVGEHFGRTSLEIVAAQSQAHITYALNLAERG